MIWTSSKPANLGESVWRLALVSRIDVIGVRNINNKEDLDYGNDPEDWGGVKKKDGIKINRSIECMKSIALMKIIKYLVTKIVINDKYTGNNKYDIIDMCMIS